MEFLNGFWNLINPDSVFKLFDRVDAYVIWFYPIIYLFWPTKRNIHQGERYVKVVNQVKESKIS